jgi:hypothetical protein
VVWECYFGLFGSLLPPSLGGVEVLRNFSLFSRVKSECLILEISFMHLSTTNRGPENLPYF